MFVVVDTAPNGHTFLLLDSTQGPVVTAGGLIFTANNDKKFRALDVDTGKVIWQADLPGIELAGYVNGQMPHFSANKVQNALNDVGKAVKGSKIHLSGLPVSGILRRPRIAGARRHPPAAEARR